MNSSIIVYHNPLDQWFWEGGALYVGGVLLVILILFGTWISWENYKSKKERKKRWLAMNETQRNQWRYFSRRNNFEMEEWEKDETK